MKVDANDVLRRDGADGLRAALDKPELVSMDRADAEMRLEVMKQRRAKPAPPPLETICARTLAGVRIPERQWIVPHWVPCGVVTGLYGDGGLGKSLLAQQLQTAAALALPWLGLSVEPTPSLGLYCEDSADELHRRQASINASYGRDFGDLGDAHWLARQGEDNLLMAFARNGVGEVTPFHRQLVERVRDLHVRLLIVDTAADTFGGDENNRTQVRQFVSRGLGSIALEIRGAVLLCAHPSRSGMGANGDGDGGSTAWSNTMRSRLYLSEPTPGPDALPDPDARILSRRKANYAGRGGELELRWRHGAIEPERQTAGLAFRRPVEDVFLSLIDAFARENQLLSESNHAGNYAPAMFAKRSEREGYKRADFDRAMHTLLTQRAIEIVDYGPPSKPRRKLVRRS